MEYDIAIIGGGPAGIMAAGRAGELGSRVVLLEKNKELGIKLLITGNGRCNFSNNAKNSKEFVSRFGVGGKFLFSSLYQFGVHDVVNFFEERGVAVKIEKDGKIFPTSNKAKDIKDVLISYLKESKVAIKTGAEVIDVVKQKGKIERIILKDKKEIIARNYIICTGGKSFPQTGSTGDGYRWAKKLGHTIVNPVPALTSVILKDLFVKELQGLCFSNVKIIARKLNNKLCMFLGDIIFTDNGISGPAIIDMSREIAREDVHNIFLEVDFFPDYSLAELDQVILEKFKKENNKTLKNCLNGLIPPRLIVVISKLAEIDLTKKVNSINKQERKKIVQLLKELRLSIKNLSGFERAYISSGGILLSEIEPSKMQSKLIENLYFAGEVLNLDGPTGGYNLQVCWSTGYTAGSKASI